MDGRVRQEGGTHYLKMTVQPWDAMRSWLTHDQLLGFFLGNAIKHLSRFNVVDVPAKGGVVELFKAQHYIAELLEACGANHDGGSGRPRPTAGESGKVLARLKDEEQAP